MVLNARMAQRYRSLLQVNKVALSGATPQCVFQGMCEVLKRLVPYERASLSLYDPDHDGLKIVDMYGPHENSIYHIGHLFSRDKSQTGWVFEHGKTMVRGNLAKELKFAADKSTMEEGYFGLCSVPLVVRGNSIGVVSVIAAQKNRLSTKHADVVEEMSNQITLAICSMIPRCSTHAKTKLVCPRCIGAAGGKTTVSKHREALSDWGKRGGRGRRNLDFC